MTTHKSFEITRESAKSLFAKGTFLVPLFQREYKWDEDDCQNFWDDVMKKKEHYAAGIVLQRSNKGYYDIIDGQQRITTISLLAIAAMRVLRFQFPGGDEKTRARCMNEVGSAFLVNNQPIWSTDWQRDGFAKFSKLRVWDDHQDVYYDLLALSPPSIVGSFHPKPTKAKGKAQYAMKSAVVVFLDNMKEQIEEGKFKSLSDVKNFIIDKMGNEIIFSLIETTDEENAHGIFETLNGKGKALKPVDLIKTYFLSAMPSEKKEKELSDKWKDIFASPLSTESTQIDFIRSVFNYWYGFTPQKKLYTAIVKSFKVASDGMAYKHVWEFMEILEAQKELYQQLLNPQDSYWQANYERIKILECIGIRRFYPLVLAAHKTSHKIEGGRDFDDDDFSEILRICVAIIIRRYLRNRPNRVLEKAFHSVAYEVHQETITSPRQIFSNLNRAERGDLYPKDTELNNISINFDKPKDKAKDKVKKELIKYILKKVEEHLSGQVEIQGDYRLCQVAHNKLLGDYVLHENRNAPSPLSELNNSSFESTTLTKWKDEWTLYDSERRQQKLVEVMVKIEEWRVDDYLIE